MTLYDILGEYAKLYQDLELTDDEKEIGEILCRLAEIEGDDLPTKIEQYTYIIKDAEGKAEMLRTEIKRLRKLVDKYDGISSRLRSAIRYAMQQSGAVQIATKIGSWTRRRNAPKVEIAYTDRIPEEYIRTVNVEYDKKKLKEALESGIEIDGVALVSLEGVSFR